MGCIPTVQRSAEETDNRVRDTDENYPTNPRIVISGLHDILRMIPQDRERRLGVMVEWSQVGRCSEGFLPGEGGERQDCEEKYDPGFPQRQIGCIFGWLCLLLSSA